MRKGLMVIVLFLVLSFVLFIGGVSANFVDNSSSYQIAYDCGNLNTSNSIYEMNQSLIINGTCFNILADNITLDCMNQTINYSSGAALGYGINVTNYDNITIRNCNLLEGISTTDYNHGIYLNNSLFSTIENNTIQTLGYYSSGIYLNTGSNYTDIFNNTLNATLNGGYGIFIKSSFYNNISNSSGLTYDWGIYLENSNYNNITNVSFNATYWDCITLYQSNYNTIFDSEFESRDDGIYIWDSNNNTVSNCTGTSRGSDEGIYIDGGNNNSILYSRGYGNNGRGLSIWGDHNYILSSNGTSTNDEGIILGEENNTLIESIGIGGNAGLELSSNNNLIINSIGSSEYWGIFVWGNNNTVSNSSFTSDNDYSAYFNEASNNTFINNTFISENESVPLLYLESSSLNNTFYWNNFTETDGYYIANYNDTNHFNTTIGGKAQGNYYYGISGKNVYDSDSDGWGDSGSDYPLNATTWSDKWIGYGSDYGPETNLITVSNCSVLNITNGVYTLTQNVSSSGTCFNVTAENVTIDCDDYWINYSQAGFGYGINVTNYTNVTIRNCNIVDGMVGTNYKHGIYLENSSYSNIYNNTLNIMGDRGDGIYIYSSDYVTLYDNILNNPTYLGEAIYVGYSLYSTVYNSDIQAEDYGIYFYYSDYILLHSMNISVNDTSGIRFSGASNSSAFNINLSSIAAFGIDIKSGSSNISVYNSTCYTQFGYCFYSDSSDKIFMTNLTGNCSDSGCYGFFITNTENSTFRNISGYAFGGNRGMYIHGENNSVYDSYGYSDTGEGIGFDGININFYNCTGNSTEYYGMDSAGCTNCSFTNITAVSTESRGFYLSSGSDSRIYNSTAKSNSGYSFYIVSSNFQLVNSLGISSGGNSPAIYLYGSNNTLSNITSQSNLSYGLNIGGNNCSVSNSSLSSNFSYSFYVGCSNSTFINNTFFSENESAYQMYILSGSSNNTFYWNNFTETGRYIYNGNSENYFNTTIGGVAQGNYYSEISSKRVYDSDSNGWGDSGQDYPLNATNWATKWGGYGSDYGPSTTREEDLTEPTYNTSSISVNSTYAGQKVKFSINITDNEALQPYGRYIFSTNNTGVWANDTPVNFTETPSLIYVTKTLSTSIGRVVAYMWYFNDSNGNSNYTSVNKLTTTEYEEEEDGGGGGGVSGIDDEPIILRPNSLQLEIGYQTIFRKDYSIRLDLAEKGIYQAKIEKINRFTGEVNFSMNKSNYSIHSNETLKINVNRDKYYDLEVSVILVTIYNSTKMMFKEINEEIPASKQLEVSENVLEDTSGNQTSGDVNTEETVTKDKVNIIFFVIVGVIVLFVIILGIFIIKRIKKQKESNKSYGFYV
ncbi:MAG: right-handed parallel beta-helix repeat-containing protein [Nanobdellota archaeon]